MDFNVFISIIGFLIILTPIVFFHEFGHFWFARLFGIKVEVFSIGFGPKLFSIKDKYGTIWQIASIPIGGYVKMHGELNVSEKTKKHSSDGSFHSASVWQRFMIVSAGPAANIVLTILIFSFINLTYGKFEVPPVIGDLVPNSEAELSGLKINDEIIKINSSKVSKFDEIRQIIIENPDRDVKLTVLRNNQLINVNVKPKSVWSKDLGLNIGQLGIISKAGEMKNYGMSESVYYGFLDTYLLTKAMLRGIIRLFTGNFQKGEIGGPVKIAEISGKALISGWLSTLYWCALISLNLGLVNLLPIPALDGGHLLLYSIEIIFRKPLPEQIQINLLRLGLSFLISLMIIITYFDISNNI